MSQPAASRAIEAILMVAQEPVDPHLLAQLLEVSPVIVEELCAQLKAAYEADDRGFVLAKVAGGYRFQSHGDLAPYVERFVLEGQSARLSSAALETLAIVAYKQPISRAQVASVRGVNVDGVMRTLQQRGYIVEVGRDPGPGQATLFGTSQEFLERLGLDTLDDLPPIADLFPSTDIMEALERGLRADRVEPAATLPLDGAERGAPDPSTEGATAAAGSTHRDDVVDHGEVATPEPAMDPLDEDASDGDVALPDLPLAVARDAIGDPEAEPVDAEPRFDLDDDLSPPAWALEDPVETAADATSDGATSGAAPAEATDEPEGDAPPAPSA